MKIRIFIIGLFFTVSAIISKSQSKSYDIGIDGGPGLAIFYASSGLFSETGFSMSGVIGIFYQYNFNETVSLKSGINYERKGAQMENRSDQFPANGNLFYNFDYLTVPIMVKAYFGQNIRFFINAGPYASYLINQSIFFNPASGNSYKLGNETNNYKPIDLGLIVGTDITFSLQKRFLFTCELRNDLGLMNIVKNDPETIFMGYYSADDVKGHTNITSILFCFAYRFEPGKQ